MSKRPVLILGIGNYLMGDEGIGVHTANMLSETNILEGVDVLDGGTGGFHLLEYFEQYETVIMIDATLDGEKPGTINLLRPRFAADFPPAMSTHDIGLKDLVGALQLTGRMPNLYLFTVSIASLQQQGVELTPEVQAVMPELIQQVSQMALNEATPSVVQG
jgi:hydrogenase maturation protease